MMKLEAVKLSTIVPYEQNAKKHPQIQIEQIKQSILKFGNNDPIAIDENNTIIEGHGRYLALKELDYETVPVIRLSHLSEQEKRAYILAHNKLTLNTDFDLELLQLELQNILEVDMSLFGFSASLFSQQEKEEVLEAQRLASDFGLSDELKVTDEAERAAILAAMDDEMERLVILAMSE